jgi:uncharacterized membrane protein
LEEGADALSKVVGFLETHNGQRLAIALFSIVATLVLVLLPGTAAAFAFGLPYMFFVPGFAIVRLFFWKGTTLEARFVLSLGISVLVIIFLGLFLVLTPIGLDSNTTRASLVVFALAAVAAEMVMNRNTEEEPGKKTRTEKVEPFKFDKVVAAMLGTALVVSGICLALIITAEYPSRTYFAMTEDDSAKINSTRVLGSNITLTIEMHNGDDGPREFSMAAYCWNDTHWDTRWYNYTMDEGETQSVDVTFALDQPGVWRFDFDLYIQEEGQERYLYGNLHLWLSVVEE